MSALTDRLAEITDAIRDAITDSDLSDADAVVVTNTGRDYINARRQSAGGIIVYPFPRITWPAPQIARVTWTIGLVAAGDALTAAARCDDLLAVIQTAGLVRWGADTASATPTDFALNEDPAAPKVPGYAITITEEHLQ